MKTIYNTAVKLESQEQAERLSKKCRSKGLVSKIQIYSDADYFRYSKMFEDFGNYMSRLYLKDNKIEIVTESEFIELLNNHKE